MWLIATAIEQLSKTLEFALDIPDAIKLVVLIQQGWRYIKSIFKSYSTKLRLK